MGKGKENFVKEVKLDANVYKLMMMMRNSSEAVCVLHRLFNILKLEGLDYQSQHSMKYT